MFSPHPFRTNVWHLWSMGHPLMSGHMKWCPHALFLFNTQWPVTLVHLIFIEQKLLICPCHKLAAGKHAELNVCISGKANKHNYPSPPTPPHTYVQKWKIKNKMKKMELLTVVLTILADGGFALQCPVIVDNKEIYLEGAEAVEFLGKRKRKHHESGSGQGEKGD